MVIPVSGEWVLTLGRFCLRPGQGLVTRWIMSLSIFIQQGSSAHLATTSDHQGLKH